MSLPLRLMAASLALWLLGGCFGPRKDNMRHFALQVPAADKAAKRQPGLLLVSDLDVSRVHDRQQMLIRRSDVEVHYERERQWADRPQTLLSDALAGYLLASGSFASVTRNIGDRPPAWVLSGRVDSFEVRVQQGQWSVHLAMRLELRRFETDAVVWRQAFNSTAPITAADHASAARGLSQLVGKALGLARQSLAASDLAAPVP